MKIICLGGGPAGLYFAISMKLQNPDADITVLERNQHDDTFGWGVVLSQETLDNLHENDPVSAKAIHDNFAYWDDLATLYRGSKIVTAGQAFSGIGRKKLLLLLQARAKELGVILEFKTLFDTPETYRNKYDIVIGCDGINSVTRKQYEHHFKPNLQTGACKFVWLGTSQKFNDAFTFIFKQTDKGWLWVHAYQFDADMATFIVECDEQTFNNYGFADISQSETCALCEEIFAEHLDGHRLISNANHIRGSSWLSFPKILCEKWTYENIALLGDAAASAHFSIGSGTKLALESAIALAKYIQQESDLQAAFTRYENERRVAVLRLQSAANNSIDWFENIHRYLDYDPIQFNYALLTRSQRIGHENLRMRDEKILSQAEEFFAEQAGFPVKTGTQEQPVSPPLFIPFKLKNLQLANRIVVAPMSQSQAENALPNDWHLTHYGHLAKGGAGLIITEMLSINPAGRISDKSAGLYNDEQAAGWQKITDFIHHHSHSKIACQIGHAGRKMDENDMQNILADFVTAAQLAQQANFDMIELSACHGGLLASFINPLTHQRDDEYGGEIHNRMRFPLQIIRAIRNVWTDDKPLSVRISASDNVADGGMSREDMLMVATLLHQENVDLCNVSTGETTHDSKLPHGRMFNVPLSDAIHNQTGIQTIVGGNIDADQANSILLAGRANLIVLDGDIT